MLRAISGQPDSFVPACAVLGSILLSMLASGAFIFFIHHISSNIQAAEMARVIARETLDMVDKYFPDQDAEEKPPLLNCLDGFTWHPVPARQWGTIQTVTLDHDPTFGVRQLVDMALKALSQGIKDSTTAETCLDHIGVILTYCGQRNLRSRDRYDLLRVPSIGIDFAQLAKMAFHQVAKSAKGNSAVLLRIMDTICKAGKACAGSAERRALLDQTDVVGEIALRSAQSGAAQAELGARLDALRELLGSR